MHHFSCARVVVWHMLVHSYLYIYVSVYLIFLSTPSGAKIVSVAAVADVFGIHNAVTHLFCSSFEKFWLLAGDEKSRKKGKMMDPTATRKS